MNLISRVPFGKAPFTRISPLAHINNRLDQVISLLTTTVEQLGAIHSELKQKKVNLTPFTESPQVENGKIDKLPDFNKNFYITQTAYNNIKNSIGRRPAETGGILLSSHHDYVVDTFVFDTGAKTSSVTYEPDVGFLRKYLAETDDHLIGIVHSHPVGYQVPSSPDINGALNNIHLNNYLDGFLLPIVQTIPDTGTFSLYAYLITPSKSGGHERHTLQVKVIPDRQNRKTHMSEPNTHEPLEIPAD